VPDFDVNEIELFSKPSLKQRRNTAQLWCGGIARESAASRTAREHQNWNEMIE
jgi:hypothetical protein